MKYKLSISVFTLCLVFGVGNAFGVVIYRCGNVCDSDEECTEGACRSDHAFCTDGVALNSGDEEEGTEGQGVCVEMVDEREYCPRDETGWSGWSKYGARFEERSRREWDPDTESCTYKEISEYRCAAGYYGASENGYTGCTQCDLYDGLYTNSALTTVVRGTSDPGNNTALTDCYVPSGTYFDTKGTKTLTSCRMVIEEDDSSEDPETEGS